MSALGQKRTCAAQKPMSALPPIATAKADSRQRSCPLYPQKRTCAVQQLMSALGQNRTSSRVRVSLSSCAQFFQYALHCLQAIWVGWSELRMHFEVSQCLLQTALLLPRNAAVVV